MEQKLSLLQRLQAPTPSFFQFAFKAGLAVAVIAGMLTGGRDALIQHGIPVPALLAKAIEVVTYMAAGVAAISKFAIRRES